MKKFFSFLILIITLIFCQPAIVNAAPNQHQTNRLSLSSSDVIAAINGYRQQYGIAPLSQNSLLSSLAQAQSDYQASINSVTHTGPGGSTPQQRASAAGYGGGSFFYLSEIIYGGYNQTTQNALSWWQNSSLHNSIMLDSKYTEIGAGVASNGDSVYFTAVLGGPTGGSSGEGSGDTGGSGTGENAQPTTAGSLIMPIQKATPQADGAIIHTVLTGQTLWTIAAVYEIELETLFEINGMNQYSYVFPGDQVVIRLPGEYGEKETSVAESDQDLATPYPQTTSPAQIIGEAYSSIDHSSPTNAPTKSNMPKPISKTPQTNPENTGLFAENPLVRNIIIAALILLIIVMLGSLLVQKPGSNNQVDDKH